MGGDQEVRLCRCSDIVNVTAQDISAQADGIAREVGYLELHFSWNSLTSAI